MKSRKYFIALGIKCTVQTVVDFSGSQHFHLCFANLSGFVTGVLSVLKSLLCETHSRALELTRIAFLTTQRDHIKGLERLLEGLYFLVRFLVKAVKPCVRDGRETGLPLPFLTICGTKHERLKSTRLK